LMDFNAVDFKVSPLALQVCAQYEGYRHCENGKPIIFNGGIK